MTRRPPWMPGVGGDPLLVIRCNGRRIGVAIPKARELYDHSPELYDVWASGQTPLGRPWVVLAYPRCPLHLDRPHSPNGEQLARYVELAVTENRTIAVDVSRIESQ